MIGAAGTPDKAQGLSLFFIGNRSGEIEPCGCVVNQLGGMQFEATLYGEVPRENSVRVDAGGWTAPFLTAELSMKTRYGLRGMSGRLDLDAVNVARQDLTLGQKYFDSLAKEYPEALGRLVSANIYMRAVPDKRAFSPYRITERKLPGGKSIKVAITGVASLSKPSRFTSSDLADEDYIVTDPNEALKPLLADLNGRADLTIVLVHGTWRETVAVAQLNPGIDVIVSSSRPPNTRDTSVLIGKTRILSVHNTQGKELGRAQLVEATQSGWTLAGEPRWLDVSPSLPAVQELVDLIDQFKRATEDMMRPKPRAVRTTFAGSQTCSSCHFRQFKSWLETPHARALQTLVVNGSQFRSECLQCHTLGFGVDNGFYNVKETLHMANVQCETCHTAAYQHATNQNLILNGTVNRFKGVEKEDFLAAAKKLVPPREVPASVCLECHHPPHDVNFSYALKVLMVNHQDSG